VRGLLNGIGVDVCAVSALLLKTASDLRIDVLLVQPL
jgi:hypothetical protein